VYQVFTDVYIIDSVN